MQVPTYKSTYSVVPTYQSGERVHYFRIRPQGLQMLHPCWMLGGWVRLRLSNVPSLLWRCGASPLRTLIYRRADRGVQANGPPHACLPIDSQITGCAFLCTTAVAALQGHQYRVLLQELHVLEPRVVQADVLCITTTIDNNWFLAAWMVVILMISIHGMDHGRFI